MRNSEDRRRTLGTVLMLVAFALVFIFILTWMYSVGLLVIPKPIAELLGLDERETGDEIPWDTGELYSMLREGSPDELSGVTFELDYENLRTALVNEPSPSGYMHTARISHYSNGNAISRRTRLYIDGDRYRIEKYADDSQRQREELVIAGRDSVYRLDDTSGEARSIPRGETFTPESEAGFPSVHSLTETLVMFPSVGESTGQGEAQAERFADCSITLIEQNGSNVYYVSFTDRLSGTSEQYWLSLEYKVIISHRTYSKGELIYSFETVGFSIDPADYSSDRLWSVS